MNVKKVSKKMLGLMLFVFASINTFASDTSMPWTTALDKVQGSITGPVAKGISIIVIAVAGLTWAFSEGGGMTGKAIRIVCGIAIALGATTIVGNMFSISSSGIALF